jgi:hypothetical protein
LASAASARARCLHDTDVRIVGEQVLALAGGRPREPEAILHALAIERRGDRIEPPPALIALAVSQFEQAKLERGIASRRRGRHWRQLLARVLVFAFIDVDQRGGQFAAGSRGRRSRQRPLGRIHGAAPK